MSKNNWRRLLAVFAGSAICSFAISWSNLAHSNQVSTVPWVACQGVGATPSRYASCTLPQGDDMPTAALLKVYYDYAEISGRTYTLNIVKESYTGSVFTDSKQYMATSSGNTDQFVTAVNVLTNASTYDYLEAWLEQSGIGTLTMYGVAEVNSL